MMNGPVAQLNRASDYGSEGYRFESCRGHKKDKQKCLSFFYFKKNVTTTLQNNHKTTLPAIPSNHTAKRQ